MPRPLGVLGAADGSGLRQVTNGESGKLGDIDPSWAPDGVSLAFGCKMGDSVGEEFIRVVDLKSNRVSVLPGSQGMWPPRWSPDGRPIAGLSDVDVNSFKNGGSRVMLYDLRTQKQSQFFDSRSGYPSWSADGEFLFFQSDSDPWARRVWLRDRKVGRVADLSNLRVAGWGWLAAAPGNSFVTAVDASTAGDLRPRLESAVSGPWRRLSDRDRGADWFPVKFLKANMELIQSYIKSPPVKYDQTV